MENQELEQLKSAEDIAGFGSFTWDLETNDMTWSSGLYKMLGVPETQEYRASLELLQSLTREDMRERVIAEAKTTAESGKPYQAEYAVEPEHDGVIWIRIKGDRVMVHGRASVVGVMLDITEQVMDRDKIAELNRQLVDALDRSQGLITMMQKYDKPA